MLLYGSTLPAGPQEEGLKWWRNDRFAIGWKGHLYLPRHPAGAASVAELAARLATTPLTQLVAELAGVFGLFVHDQVGGEWQAASDNAGLYRIFYDERGLATSFLELLANRKLDASAISPLAVLEFLSYGAWLGPGSPAAGVRRLAHDEILVLAPGARPQLASKALTAPKDDDTNQVLVHFDNLARSLEHASVSVDVTAGYDSRVIAGLLAQRGVDFEAAVSGYPGSEDVEIGRIIADTLRRPFVAWHHDESTLEEDLPALFKAGDGLTDLRRFHRDYQNAKGRIARGIDIIVHGNGGELFKDQYSYQDFPFYGRSRSNFERYYSLRVVPVSIPPTYLTPSAQSVLADVRPHAIALMKRLVRQTNNETYNCLWYFLRSGDHVGQFYSNYINSGLNVAAPYLDFRVAHVGMRLPPWQTIFTRWHRKVITQTCPAIAPISTSDGYTASSEWRHLPRNLAGYASTQMRRAAKKASQKLLGRTMFHKAGAFAADAPGFVDRLRSSRSFTQAVQRLQVAGILSLELQPAAVRDIHVGRILTMGLLLAHLDRARPVVPELPQKTAQPALDLPTARRTHITRIAR